MLSQVIIRECWYRFCCVVFGMYLEFGFLKARVICVVGTKEKKPRFKLG